MACTTFLTQITTSCGSNLPSIKKLYIGTFESGNFTYTYQKNGENQDVLDADGNQIIESVSGATLNSGADKWVEFSFRKNTCSMNSEMTSNDNGSYYFTNGCDMIFSRIENSKRLSIESLAAGECTMIVVDNNNNTWIIGLESPVSLTTLSATTGTSISDNNQYTVTLSAIEAHMPILIDKEQSQTVINTLMGIGA